MNPIPNTARTDHHLLSACGLQGRRVRPFDLALGTISFWCRERGCREFECCPAVSCLLIWKRCNAHLCLGRDFKCRIGDSHPPPQGVLSPKGVSHVSRLNWLRNRDEIRYRVYNASQPWIVVAEGGEVATLALRIPILFLSTNRKTLYSVGPHSNCVRMPIEIRLNATNCQGHSSPAENLSPRGHQTN